MSLPTVSDRLRTHAEEITGLLADFFLNHCQAYLPPPREGPWGTTIVNVAGPYEFRELGPAGRQLQSRILAEYTHFATILRQLLAQGATDRRRDFDAANRRVLRFMELSVRHHPTTRGALKECSEAIAAQVALLDGLYDPTDGETVFVPDTNAFYYNPILEAWSFDDAERFTILLLPTVMSELDEHKDSHRNEQVRQKAEKLIRVIKEYRRRGALGDGVPIIKDGITLRTIATEPRGESFLPWMDKTNHDDRILASVIEVMQRHPRSAVVLVTRDINMQNKADHARLPVVEPPDPTIEHD